MSTHSESSIWANEPLAVGDYLHASCSDEIYGEVVALGKDANGVACVDLRIFAPDDILSWPDAEDDDGQLGGMGKNKEWPEFFGCASIELPPGVTIVLRGLQYKLHEKVDPPGRWRWGKHGDDATHVSTGRNILVLTPGGRCSRCTKFFSIARRP